MYDVLTKSTRAFCALWMFFSVWGSSVAAQDVSVFLVNNPLLTDNRAHYPVYISGGRGYPMRCASQTEEDSLIRALGFLTVPSRILEPTDPVIVDADPSANPDLCPAADDYPIQVFVNSTPEGTKHYLQFVDARGSSTTTGRLYVPGCVELIEALNIDLDLAVASDPTVFFAGKIHELDCNEGQTAIDVVPQSFAEWCTKADLTEAQADTVRALLNATPAGSNAMGDTAACAAAEQFLTSLTTLNMAGGSVESLEPLASLSHLSALTLDNNAIEDVAPLASMVNLTQLSLADTDFSSVAGLAPLANLVTLNLAGNEITDLRPLTSLTNLTTLDLARNPLGSLAPLESLAALQNLSLANSGQTGPGLEPLTGLQSLAFLDLTGNVLTDLSALGAFPSSVSIAGIGGSTGSATDFLSLCIAAREAGSPQGFTIRAIIETLGAATCTDSAAELASRVSIDLSAKSIADISPLATATHLTDLNLSGNAISDIGDLSGLTAMRTLDLSDNDIVDITPLAPMTVLQTLNATGNSLQTGDFLSACILRDQGEEVISPAVVAEVAALKSISSSPNCLDSYTRLRTFSSVSVADKGLTTVTLFRVLQNTQSLTISDNPVTDIRPLAGLPRLKTLHATDTQLTETSGFPALRGLTTLVLDRSPIGNLNALIQLPELKTLSLRNVPATRVSALASMPRLESAALWGMPLDPKLMSEYCLIHRYTSGMLQGARNTVSAILTAAAAANVDPEDCKSVQAWSRTVTRLNLNRRSISDVKPITLMPELKELFLQDNNLSIGLELRFLRNLKTLNLSKNRLTEVPLLFADNLENLYLSENQIVRTEQLGRHTQLKRLNLKKNRIANPSGATALNNLIFFDIRDNQISSFGLAMSILSKNPFLKGNPVCAQAEQTFPGNPVRVLRTRCRAEPPTVGLVSGVLLNPVLEQPILVAPLLREGLITIDTD